MKKWFNNNLKMLPILWILMTYLFFSLQLYNLHLSAYFLEIFLIITSPVVTFFVRKDWKMNINYGLLNLFLLATWGFGTINQYTHKNHKFIILLGGVCFLSSIVISFSSFLKNNSIKKSSIKKVVKSYQGAILISLIFLVFSIDVINNIPFLDESAYYGGLHRILYYFDFSFNDMKEYLLATHISIGYALLGLFAEMIVPFSAVSFHFMLIFLAIFSIFCFYYILQNRFADFSKSKKIIATAIYAFSPFVLGTVGLINLDTITIYAFVIILAAFLADNIIMELLAIYLFIFSKEPAIIYYFFMTIGILFYDWLNIDKYKKKEKKIFGFLGEEFIKYIPEIIVPIIWLVDFKSLDTPWNQAILSHTNNNVQQLHQWGFTWNNFLEKTKQIFILNYNWLIIILIIILLICLLCSKSKSRIENIIVIPIGVLIGVLVFNYFFLDFLTPRYISLGSEMIVVIFIILLLSLNEKIYSSTISAFLALILLVQSLISIDPISNSIFKNVDDYGNNMLITGNTVGITDDVIYNREYSYYNKNLNNIFSEIKYDNNTAVITLGLPYVYYSLLWDTKKEIICPMYNDNTIEINRVGEDVVGEYARVVYIMPLSYQVPDYLDETNIKTMRYRTISVKYCVVEK